MKKITLSFCFASFAVFGFAQSNIVLLDESLVNVSGTIINVNVPISSSVTNLLLVKNTGSSTETTKVLRTILSVDAADITQFCYGGSCYSALINLSDNSLAIPSGSTYAFSDGGFDATFNTSIVSVTRLVHYTFFNINNPSDSTGVTFRYMIVSGAGIDEATSQGGKISDVYPNPVTSNFNIAYQLNDNTQNSKIVFYDVLGKSIKEIALTNKEGVEKVNKNDFNSGIYFYSLVVNDKIISSKKLIVSSN